MTSTAHRQPWELREEGDKIVVELRGDLDEPGARELERALAEQLRDHAPGSRVVLFDLNQLRRCNVEAREVLARIQRSLGGVARRSAWITKRPIFRGLALWICHHAPDSNARSFPSEADAERWLGSNEAREAVLERDASSWIGRVRGRLFLATEAAQ